MLINRLNEICLEISRLKGKGELPDPLEDTFELKRVGNRIIISPESRQIPSTVLGIYATQGRQGSTGEGIRVGTVSAISAERRRLGARHDGESVIRTFENRGDWL